MKLKESGFMFPSIKKQLFVRPADPPKSKSRTDKEQEQEDIDIAVLQFSISIILDCNVAIRTRIALNKTTCTKIKS